MHSDSPEYKSVAELRVQRLRRTPGHRLVGQGPHPQETPNTCQRQERQTLGVGALGVGRFLGWGWGSWGWGGPRSNKEQTENAWILLAQSLSERAARGAGRRPSRIVSDLLLSWWYCFYTIKAGWKLSSARGE